MFVFVSILLFIYLSIYMPGLSICMHLSFSMPSSVYVSFILPSLFLSLTPSFSPSLPPSLSREDYCMYGCYIQIVFESMGGSLYQFCSVFFSLTTTSQLPCKQDSLGNTHKQHTHNTHNTHTHSATHTQTIGQRAV